MELFEIATRNKYRFPFKGWISTEDLWDLSVQNLDSIFKTLNKEFKTTGEESLLGTKTTEQNELSNKIEIVKHIVSVKLADKAKAQTARENAERRQQLLEVLAKNRIRHSMICRRQSFRPSSPLWTPNEPSARQLLLLRQVQICNTRTCGRIRFVQRRPL